MKRRRFIATSAAMMGLPSVDAVAQPNEWLRHGGTRFGGSGQFDRNLAIIKQTSRLEAPLRLLLPVRRRTTVINFRLQFSASRYTQRLSLNADRGLQVSPRDILITTGQTSLPIRIEVPGGLSTGTSATLLVEFSIDSRFRNRLNIPISLSDRDGAWQQLGRLDFCPVHAASLPDDRILFFSYYDRDKVSHDRGRIQLINALTRGRRNQRIGNATVLENLNPFCAGHSFLGDGQLLIAGGHVHGTHLHVMHGNRVHLFDPGRSGSEPQLSRQQDMQNHRWYPTCLTMATGDAMIIGGSRPGSWNPFNGLNDDLEWFSLSSQGLRQTAPRRPHHRDYPADPVTDFEQGDRRAQEGHKQLAGLYPLMHLLPARESQAQRRYGVAFVLTEMMARLYDFARNEILGDAIDVGGFRTWPTAAASVLLPIDIDSDGGGPPHVEIMIIGGGSTGQSESSHRALSQASILRYDIDAQQLSVMGSVQLQFQRIMGDAVLLPNSSICLIGGAQFGHSDSPGGRLSAVEIIEQSRLGRRRWRTRRAASAMDRRGYHATAALTTDGSVVVAGGNERWDHGGPRGVEYTSVERYQPPYFQAGSRPAITRMSGLLGYGGEIVVDVDDTNLQPWITIIRFGSRTHSLDTDQRLLRLAAIDYDPSQLTIRAMLPRNETYAPPGYYMLFVSQDRVGEIVPSVGRPFLLRRTT